MSVPSGRKRWVDFHRGGQALLTILFAMLGGLAARRFYEKSTRA